jgi:FkbM family methyltransferase
MSIMGAIARHSGAKAFVQKALGAFGYTAVLKRQVGHESWLGLPSIPFRTVLDVGACNGGFANDLLRPRFPGAIIHSFEPSPVSFAGLKKIADRSGGSIIAHNFGLGAVAETTTLNSTVDLLAASSLLASTREQFAIFPVTARTQQLTVEIKVLDEIAPSLAIVDDLLVKIDVQGFEDRVIAGGRNTIARAKACIIEIQIAELYAGQPSFRDLFMAMDSMGFAFNGVLDQYSGDKGHMLYFDAVFIKA